MNQSSFKKTLYNNVYSKNKPPGTSVTRLDFSSSPSPGLGLYRYVFASKMAVLSAFLLCISLLLQPVAKAYAEEITPAPVTELVGSAANINTEAELILNEVAETETEEDIVIEPLETVVISEVDDAAATASVGSDSASVADLGEQTEVGVLEDEELVNSSSELATGEQVASTTEATEQSVEATDEDFYDDAVDAVVVTTAATSTGETIAVSTLETDSKLAFGKNECTEVADGSFYCQKLSLDNLPQDALFAAPDSTGDLEIFVVQDGIERKVTNNTVDDASPYYDARSETLVWHRLVQDRYQIISYDIGSGEETQLTDTSVNNMEPTRSGDHTVWQRWVKNNWEIILFDGKNERQLTNSMKHDIAPHIRGDLIIWNVRASDGTESLMTYSIADDTFNEIADPDGVSVANPRMLVMYEAQYQNGDTVMKGFDLVTGEIVPIDRFPRELPDKIPSPETTGETRALPTSNPNDEEPVTQVDPEPEPASPPDMSVGTTTVTSGPETLGDLDLRPVEVLDSESTASTSDRIVEQATIPDIIVPPFVTISADSASTSAQ